VKVWPGTADARSLAAQMEVQAAMAARDFPASAVLTKLSALGAGWAVSMEYNQAVF
jgi:superfamily II helicase